MKGIKNWGPMDKKRLLRQSDHFTMPPRLEGKVKNAMMQPVRKKKATIRRMGI